MEYKCKECGFVHYGEMKDGYYCPVCKSSSHNFTNIKEEKEEIYRVYVDPDNPSLQRTEEKCIGCGACANTCINTVGIWYKDPKVPVCINCGQCVLTCPSGALSTKYDYNDVIDLINDKDKTVIAITAPSVRVSIGDAFGYDYGEFLEGKLNSALKEIGFDYVFDASFGADLTVMEEATELQKRVKEDKNLPLFTSCCPSFLKYMLIYYPELENHFSTCKTPLMMLSTIIKKILNKELDKKAKDIVVVSITPCTAKKYETIGADTDYSLTTTEVAHMIKENNIDFNNLKDKDFDSLYASSSGVLFGTAGGVMTSILRTYYFLETGEDLDDNLIYRKEKEHYVEYKLKVNDKVIKAASVYRVPNFKTMLDNLNDFQVIEVMNCEMGCIGGGGQIVSPVNKKEEVLKKRSMGLKNNDKKAKLKYPYKNPNVVSIYDEYLDKPLSEKSKKLLHVKEHKIKEYKKSSED